MIKRKTDVLDTYDLGLTINGDRAIIADRNRRVFVIDPGDWNKFRVSQINETLEHHFQTGWFIAARGGGRQAVRAHNDNQQYRQAPRLIPEGLAVAVPATLYPSAADLEGYDLPPCLYKSLYWESSNLKGVTFRGAHFRPPGSFSRCEMSQVQFVNGCHLGDMVFSECSMPGANFGDSRLEEVTFSRCHLEGADFTDCLFVGRVRFIECTGNSIKWPQSPDSTWRIWMDDMPF